MVPESSGTVPARRNQQQGRCSRFAEGDHLRHLRPRGALLLGPSSADANVTPKQVRDLAKQHRSVEVNLRACATSTQTPAAQRGAARRAFTQAQRRRVASVRMFQARRLPAARSLLVASRTRMVADLRRCRVRSIEPGIGFELPGSSGRSGAQPLGDSSQALAGTPMAGPVAQRLVAAAEARLGRPYSYGSSGPSAFDCSGLVWAVYRAAGINYPRTSTYIEWNGGIAAAWSRSTDINDLRVGDIVYFRPSSRGPGHSGVYVGDGQIIHASSGSGQVRRDTLLSGYYNRNFVGVLRHRALS